MRAVLSLPAAIHREHFPAGQAGMLYHGFPVDLVQVAVPPGHPAPVGTEDLRLSARHLHDGLAALFTISRFLILGYDNNRWCALTGLCVPLAE